MEWKRTFRDSKKLDPSSVPIPTAKGGSLKAEDGDARMDLSESELDMSYLLKRGKSFFENGDIDSAIEVWLDLQKMWAKLVNIFMDTDDIRQNLPEETKMIRSTQPITSS